MVQIITSGQINVPALTTDDAYISVVAPPNFITGVPTDVVGMVGTASWGPKNTPVHLGSGLDATQQFGQMSSVSVNDVHDLATDLYLTFGQSTSQATLEAYAVRVSDGTDTAATGTITVGAAATPETATIAGSLTVGDVLHLTATSSAISGSPVSVTYITRAGDTPTSMGAGLAAAVNANAALAAVGVYAVAATGVVTLYWPAALSPTITWSESVTGTASETITLASGSGGAGGVAITALYTGVLGNLCTAVVSAGTQANTWNVTLIPPVGLSEVYTNLPSAGFSQALVSAINNGQSAARGPSNSFSAAWVAPGVGAPAAGTTTFANGTDGRSGVTTATLLGSGTTTPATGLYALGDLNPAVGIVWCCGLTDTAAAATILQFCQSYGATGLIPFASGQTVSSAITLANNTGVADPSIMFQKDWIYFYDTINAIQRLVPSSPVIGGTWATLGPAQSPGNKPVNLVIGTERNNPQTGNQQYSVSEIGQLESAGITLITNPIPRGRVFGIRHGQTSSLVAATKPAEYWRMTMYLARSAGNFIGSYVNELQSQSAQDPLRAGFNLQSNQFLNSLTGKPNPQIDNFLVTCKFSSLPNAQPGLGMNTPSSVAQHYMFALWQVTYLSNVRFFVLSLQGGTTVVEVSGSLTQQQATLQPN